MEGAINKMLSIILHSSKQDEIKILETVLRELIAFSNKEDLKIRHCSDLYELESKVKQSDNLDLIFIDITDKRAVNIAEKLRKYHKDVMIILIVDNTISPVEYIKPTILAAALLLRPINFQAAKKTMKEVLFFTKQQHKDIKFIFSISGNIYQIPFHNILYFESREKKVFLRTAHKEYGFHDTMDKLQQKLPDEFLRCHKSYIINKTFMTELKLSKNILILQNNILIPLSRTYKDSIKKWKNGDIL